MTIGTKTLSLVWTSVLGLIGIRAWGYSIYDDTNPTGSSQLVSRGYTYSPPRFTGHKNLDHGCYENLFKEDEGFKIEKLYGCGVAKIDLWENKHKTDEKTEETKTVDYIVFSSEFSIRKGNQGWKINTRFDNHTEVNAKYSHYVTAYKREEGQGWTEEDAFFITVGTNHRGALNDGEGDVKVKDRTDKQKYDIFLGNQKLNIKVPNESWYEKDNYLIQYDLDEVSSDSDEGTEETEDDEHERTREGLNETHTTSKSWSGIWIEDNSPDSFWIFQDIEIFIEDKKYSRFFCKNNPGEDNGCWQQLKEDGRYNAETEICLTKESSVTEKVKTWEDANNAHETKTHDEVEQKIREKVEPIIKEIQDKTGKWINAEDFCSAGQERTMDESQLQDLKLFCSAKQK